MTLRVVFSQDKEVAQQQFDTLFNGFHLGQYYTVTIDGKGTAQARDERRTDVRVLRALKTVSVEDESAPLVRVAQDAAFKQRKVTPGAELVMEGADFKRLEKYVERVPWPADKIEVVEDVLTWVGKTEEVGQA